MFNSISEEKPVEVGIRITPDEFSMEVERRTWEDKDEDSYLFHAAKYIEELNLDAEDWKKLISPSLLDKIRNEALRNRMLKDRHTTTSVIDF